MQSLRRSQLLGGLPDSEIDGLLDAASEVSVQLGDVISAAGEPDDALYIVAAGKVRIVAATKSGRSVTIALQAAGSSFGENVLQSPYPFATARAAGSAVVYRIPGPAVRTLANREPSWAERIAAVAKTEQRLVFLRTLDLFASLTVLQAREVADGLRTVTLAPGQILFREGEVGDSCYLVYRGELKVVRAGPEGWIPIRTLTEGDVVGEIALLLNRPRNASVVALQEAVVLEMSRDVFASCASGEAFEQFVARIASDRMIQIDAIVAEARSRPKIPRLVTSRVDGRFGILENSLAAVSVDQPEFAAEACLRTLDLRFRRTSAESRELRRPESWSSARSLDELGAEAESRGYLTRLVHLSSKDLSALKLPAVIQSGEGGFQTIYAISRGQVLSAHTSHGLLREPVPEMLSGWNHWALSIELIPEMSSAGITVRGLPSLLLPLFRPWIPLLFGLLAVTLLMECLSLVEPFFSRIIVDRVLVYRDGRLLHLLAFGALFASLLRMCAMSLQQYMSTYPLNSMSASLQLNLFRHILGLATGGIAGWDTPRFLARFAENTRILDVVMQRGVSLLVDSASIAIYFFAMLSLNPRLSFVAAVFLAGWAILLLVASPWLRRLQLATFNKGVAFEGFFLDAVGGIFTVKSIGPEGRVQSRGMELLCDHRKLEFRTQAVSVGVGAFSEALTSGSTLAVLGYGAVLALSGEITAGQLIAFQALMGLTFGPLNSLVGFWNDLVDLRGCLERTSEVFRLPKETSKPSACTRTLEGDVEFHNVTFHYPGSNKAALRDFSLKVRAGQKVALVGRSGAGKTTIANLLAALYDPSSGAIVFDSTDQRDFGRSHLRRQIGVVEQQPYLFNGTIRDNITKARPAASFDDIVSVATLAGLHSFVSELPMGYDTQIGERGMTLSGGQKQRIVIARALLNQPRILVLDEATSALDTISESIIQQNLDRVTSGRTSFVIAHRLSTVRNADLIAVIDDGRLAEKGTHDELMAAQGLYHHLYARGA